MGCSKELLGPEGNSPIFEITYFDFNNSTNEIFFYSEVKNDFSEHTIDSVWVELYSVNNLSDPLKFILEINEQSISGNSDNAIYSITNVLTNFISDTYISKFQLLFDGSDVMISEPSLNFLSSISEPIAPEILSIDLPESFELDLTEWSFLPIQLTIFDSNGLNDISLVKFEVLRVFEGCLDDSDGDGDIDVGVNDFDYIDGGNNTELMFEALGQNNSFIYLAEPMPMRPADGSALVDPETGDIIYPATDCGKTGVMFFRFTVTDQFGFQEIKTDISIEILSP
jgi:hypothetical protein